ncbi:uncharacterized protein DNG_07080 [Cephalotrichum gorgonifer]|uniref:Uncharacterized protein n=1 Tax=Cephalotrichum gorgonifer TaxID=2041049 RepID=A0AAE8SX24_9PEZI|nr:uncharacterized protein DNG_07080 [Cephalotrichum gorgonifer]
MHRVLHQWVLGSALILLSSQINTSLAHSNGADTLLAGLCRHSKAGPLLPSPDAQSCPLAVDDATTAEVTGSSWGAWSFRPTCAYPPDKSSSKYCVYTYIDPHGGRADISIITTPETAAEAVGLLEDPDPRWYKWNEPTAPPPVDAGGEGEAPPYELREIPGKGIGLVATRKILRGEVILSDPATVISMLGPPQGISAAHKGILARKAFSQLGEETRRDISELTGAEGGFGVEGIFSDNMFTIVLAGRQRHRGLFTRVATKLLSPLLTASTDAPINVPTEIRKSLLLRQWGFNCTCRLCSHPEASGPSDGNKQRIQDILELIKDTRNRDYETLEGFACEMLGLAEREGMTMQLGDFYGALARTYREAGFLEHALTYADMAVEKFREYIGEDSEHVVEGRKFVHVTRMRMRMIEAEKGNDRSGQKCN